MNLLTLIAKNKKRRNLPATKTDMSTVACFSANTRVVDTRVCMTRARGVGVTVLTTRTLPTTVTHELLHTRFSARRKLRASRLRTAFRTKVTDIRC